MTTKKAFKWNKTTTPRAIELYTAKLEKDGANEAATTVFLATIAADVGAISAQSVRGKLTREGVYQKPEQVASVAKTTKIRKEHFIRVLVNLLGLDAEEVDSLKNAKQGSLEAITKALGVTNIEEASAAGYQFNNPAFVLDFMAELDVTVDCLEGEQAAQQEAADKAAADKAAADKAAADKVA